MEKQRRYFIQKTGILMAATAIAPNILLSTHRPQTKKLGVALVAPGEEGLRDIRVVGAIYRSAAQNCTVTI